MAYSVSAAPYQRGTKTTFQIMCELAIAELVVWLFAMIMSFVKLGPTYGVRSILILIIALAVTALCDVATTIAKNYKDKKEELGKKILHDLKFNYSWITAINFVLLCPVWTRYYVVAVGAIFATLVVKNFFGGFGKNIFNPSAMGRIFIQLCFDLSAPTGLTNVSGLSATGATVTSVYNSTQSWLGASPITGFSTFDIMFGQYFGTMGETCTVLLLVIGVIFALRGVINWRAPVFYIGTVTIASLIAGLCLGINPGLYIIYQLCLGGLMFGAVFMLTDPVTTPTSSFGNCIAGIVAALLTMLIRIATNSVEGVVYSIAFVNLISPLIDAVCTAKTNANLKVKYGVTFGSMALVILIVVLVAVFTKGV